MKPFNAPSVVLVAPDEWFDATTYVVVGPKVADGRPSMVVNIVRNPQDKEPAAHLSRQLPEIEKLPEFKLVSRGQTKVGGMEAAIVEYTWKQPAGPKLRQRQWCIAVKGGDFYTLTATAPDEAFASLAAKFDDMVKSFKPLTW